jgi:hypothetical protein
VSVSAYNQVLSGQRRGIRRAHQPAEQVYDNKMFVTWFSGGLRVVDISHTRLAESATVPCRVAANQG